MFTPKFKNFKWDRNHSEFNGQFRKSDYALETNWDNLLLSCVAFIEVSTSTTNPIHRMQHFPAETINKKYILVPTTPRWPKKICPFEKRKKRAEWTLEIYFLAAIKMVCHVFVRVTFWLRPSFFFFILPSHSGCHRSQQANSYFSSDLHRTLDISLLCLSESNKRNKRREFLHLAVQSRWCIWYGFTVASCPLINTPRTVD